MASRLRLFWWSLAAFLVCFFSLGTILSLRSGSAESTELVVVLGGGGTERFATGLQIVQSGKANELLLIHPRASQTLVAKEAAGADRLAVFTDVLSRSSWDEAVRTRAWMSEHGVTRVAVVSDPPHMLRLTYAWSRVFAGTSLSYSRQEWCQVLHQRIQEECKRNARGMQEECKRNARGMQEECKRNARGMQARGMVAGLAPAHSSV